MISLSLGMIAIAGFLSVYITFLTHSESAVIWRNADNQASMAIERIVRGFGDTKGLREFGSDDIDHDFSTGEWNIKDTSTGSGYSYSAEDQAISDQNGNIIIEDVAESTLSYSNNCINLSIAIVSMQGQLISTQEYRTTVQPRNQ